MGASTPVWLRLMGAVLSCEALDLPFSGRQTRSVRSPLFARYNLRSTGEADLAGSAFHNLSALARRITMSRLGLAFKVLFNASFAKQVEDIGEPSAVSHRPVEPKPAPAPAPKPPARSDAITLLATLQREARALDFFKEPITDYTDAQIGAAVRDVHRQTADVLERMFALRPLLDASEGSTVAVPDNADANRFKLTGNVVPNSKDVSGELMHHGWAATKCDIAKWTGQDADANVVAAAEVEVR